MERVIIEKIEDEKAITLVALVITIIILLILAGITILSISSNNGLFIRAKQAKNNTILAQEEENIALESYEIAIDSVVGDKFPGKIDVSKNRTLSGDISGYSYKNPVIPQGFYAIDTEDARWIYKNEKEELEVDGWNNGLVISDGVNEFVWVPVDGINVIYAKWCVMGGSYSSCSDAADTNITVTNGVTYKSIPVTESTQIATYQGFYVARYEAGSTNINIDANSTTYNNTLYEAPVSTRGAKIWNNVDYNHAFVDAQLMINNSNKYGNVISGIITGTQWDTIMKWYKNSNIGIGTTDGTTQNWGSYCNITYYIQPGEYFLSNSSVGDWTSIISELKHIESSSTPYHFHAAGLNNDSYKKNIADMAGNVEEWSAERYSSYRIHRGGNAGSGASVYPASNRNGNYATETYSAVGFRCVLYIQ